MQFWGAICRYCRIGGFSVAALLAASAASAFDIDTGNPDISLRWDTTVKYSAGFRVKKQSAALISCGAACVNADDGDRGFNRGLISNRFDLLTEADLTYKDVGARVSAAGWYDFVYNRPSDHNSPATFNAVSVPFPDFTHATEELHGRKVEVLDAFVFGKGRVGEVSLSGRLGQHAVLYGESLFFGNNGIAGGQSPIDAIKARSVPNTQFKELIRPVLQASGQVQVTPQVTVGGYYQFKWQKTRLPAVGSYFSTGDILDAGGERLLTPVRVFSRAPDIAAKDSGQYGMLLRYRAEAIDTDFGFYAIRYHDKSPQVYQRLASSTYVTVYPENIKAYGASFANNFGALSLAGEISTRRNTPLVSESQADRFGLPPVAGGTTAPGDNRDNPLYAVGNSLHAQLSFAWAVPPNFIAREAGLVGEVAWNRRLRIDRNPQALAANSTRDAWGFRVVTEPMYRQVLPGLDLSVPIGFSYFPKGASSVVSTFGPNKGGDFNIGLTGVYEQVWRIGLAYTGFYGAEGTFLNAAQQQTFKQSLKDRDFISFAVQRTF
jgi:hypothetical protein